jgi:arylsulfatase A-like enzyme
MDKPNIVFLFPDQFRSDFSGCYGADWLETPNIDRIAADGIKYTNAFSASPICVPARTALLTGMNAIKNGVTDNLHNLRADWRDSGVKIWTDLLSESGYYTAGIGKMHFYPWDERRGFEYRVVCEDKRWTMVRDDYYDYLKQLGLKKLRGDEMDGYHENKGAVIQDIPWEHSWDHFVGNEAVKFINHHGTEKPFALMVGFPGPHCPYDPNEIFLEGIDDKNIPEPIKENLNNTEALRLKNIEGNKRSWNGVDYTEFSIKSKMKIRKHYSGLVQQIDYEVGQILDALEKKGILDNTYIVLASDHGDYLGDHGFIGKATFFESSIRIPMVLMGPGIDKNQTVNEMVELTDITSTILKWAGLPLPDFYDSEPLPGEGMSRQKGRDRIFGLLSDGWMNFDGRYKLHKYSSGEVFLFDISEDPDEQNNLANSLKHRKIVERLDRELTHKIMESVSFSMHDRLGQTGDMSQSDKFGLEGWSRPWPHPPHL